MKMVMKRVNEAWLRRGQVRVEVRKEGSSSESVLVTTGKKEYGSIEGKIKVKTVLQMNVHHRNPNPRSYRSLRSWLLITI